MRGGRGGSPCSRDWQVISPWTLEYADQQASHEHKVAPIAEDASRGEACISKLGQLRRAEEVIGAVKGETPLKEGVAHPL